MPIGLFRWRSHPRSAENLDMKIIIYNPREAGGLLKLDGCTHPEEPLLPCDTDQD
jgi:hypothetical protein